MEAEKPGWLRALYIVIGVLVLILGILVLVYPDLGLALILILFGIGLAITGVWGLVVGFARTALPGWARALSAVIGILVIILLILIILYPDIGIFLQVLFLGIGLLALGIFGIAFGATNPALAGWARALAAVLGVGSIALAITMILFYESVGEPTLILFFAIGLFINGISAVAVGADP